MSTQSNVKTTVSYANEASQSLRVPINFGFLPTDGKAFCCQCKFGFEERDKNPLNNEIIITQGLAPTEKVAKNNACAIVLEKLKTAYKWNWNLEEQNDLDRKNYNLWKTQDLNKELTDQKTEKNPRWKKTKSSLKLITANIDYELAAPGYEGNLITV